MQICDLSSSTGRLQRSATRLKEQWAATKEHWNDATRSEFQEKHLEPIAPEITLLMASVNRFAEALRKAQKDLTDEADGGIPFA